MGAMKARSLERDQKIRKLNDVVRLFNKGGFWALSPGIQNLPSKHRSKIRSRVKMARTFWDGPYHDSQRQAGRLTVYGEKIEWRIDYLAWGRLSLVSPDPSDQEETTRRLYIRLLGEL